MEEIRSERRIKATFAFKAGAPATREEADESEASELFFVWDGAGFVGVYAASAEEAEETLDQLAMEEDEDE